jgi:transcriptional regulator with XRE-family HTH domain
MDRGLSQHDVGRAVGLSPAQVSRIERGLVAEVSVRHLSVLLAVVGLELSARAYPSGQPIRDRAHTQLLDRLRGILHPSLRMRTEVPMPDRGDLRGWDAVVVAQGWADPVEAETRPTDMQALQRRIALKLRDSGFAEVILLLLDSRHNRALVREHRGFLSDAFPVPGHRALELLGAGVKPGGSSIVLL